MQIQSKLRFLTLVTGCSFKLNSLRWTKVSAKTTLLPVGGLLESHVAVHIEQLQKSKKSFNFAQCTLSLLSGTQLSSPMVSCTVSLTVVGISGIGRPCRQEVPHHQAGWLGEKHKRTEGCSRDVHISGRVGEGHRDHRRPWVVWHVSIKPYTGRARLIRSHSSARFCFELSGNSN